MQCNSKQVTRLPSEVVFDRIDSAKLPQVYKAAQMALTQCQEVDECAKWANKADALASYARQSKDETLEKLCIRIKARAIKRCGELMEEFDSRGDHRKSNGADTFSKRQAAASAGLSKRQQDTATRVANVPRALFEEMVESDDPPTVTKLAAVGVKPRPKPPIDLRGRNPKDFEKATWAIGMIKDFSLFCEKEADWSAIVRGCFDYDLRDLRKRAKTIQGAMAQLEKLL